MTRLVLPDGQWADLRERLSYGDAHAVKVALLRSEQDPILKADVDIALVRAYVEAWHVLSLDGSAVPLPEPELAPDDVIQAIALEAIGKWQGRQVTPKVGNARSRNTPRALRSA